MHESSQPVSLENLSGYFHENCRQLERDRLRKQESVVYRANCGFHNRFGYLVITSERYIAVNFEPQTGLFGPGRLRLDYEKKSTIKWPTYDAPQSELTKKELQSQGITEILLDRIIGVNRQDYEVNIGVYRATLVSLMLDVHDDRYSGWYSPILYSLQDGRQVYDLLGSPSSRPDHQRRPTSSSASDIPSLIESLAQLHAVGVLSDQEYESKKRELLSRM